MPDPTNPDRHLWIDVETTGLNPKDDFLLEVGLRLTTLTGQKIAEISRQINYLSVDGIRSRAVPFVQDMHDKNGLWRDCETQGSPINVVKNDLINFLKDAAAEGMALSGSSVQFDRSWIEHKMPQVAELFHYREINVSTVKELCRRYNRPAFERFEPQDTDHRVWNCLDASIHEMNYYVEHFLKKES